MLKGMYLHLFCEGCGKNYGNAIAFPADDEGWVSDIDDISYLIDKKGWGLYLNEAEDEFNHEVLCPVCAEKRKVKNNPDLATVYVEYMKKLENGEINKKYNTWNDFYDYAGIPVENRSDFATAAILNKLVERKEI